MAAAPGGRHFQLPAAPAAGFRFAYKQSPPHAPLGPHAVLCEASLIPALPRSTRPRADETFPDSINTDALSGCDAGALPGLCASAANAPTPRATTIALAKMISNPFIMTRRRRTIRCTANRRPTLRTPLL